MLKRLEKRDYTDKAHIPRRCPNVLSWLEQFVDDTILYFSSGRRRRKIRVVRLKGNRKR